MLVPDLKPGFVVLSYLFRAIPWLAVARPHDPVVKERPPDFHPRAPFFSHLIDLIHLAELSLIRHDDHARVAALAAPTCWIWSPFEAHGGCVVPAPPFDFEGTHGLGHSLADTV